MFIVITFKMNKIRHILLDLDRTLLDFDKAMDNSIREVLTQLGYSDIEEGVNAYAGINSRYWKMLERKEITFERLEVERFRDLARHCGFDIEADYLAECYMSRLAKNAQKINGADFFLDYLYPRYPMSLVTNGISRITRSRCKIAGLMPYFENLFISSEIGVSKPDRGYFDYVLNALEIDDPAEILIVGDSLSADIKGGKNAGLTTMWYSKDGKEDSSADFVIKNLFDIADVIR
ncbi:MAG: noncanonical pyrimidine nucleotidase, YjjG family [Clostridiales bacterium]|nr:noncanonical pyrimidine nucleotidase, YjjG family [Clostridiales bacterium]